MAGMGNMFEMSQGSKNSVSINGFTLKLVDEFCYSDPVDGSISKHQGVRFIFTDGSRIVFRLSGTGVAGATIRMYIEKYESSKGNLHLETEKALKLLIEAGLKLSKLEQFTGRLNPTVIT